MRGVGAWAENEVRRGSTSTHQRNQRWVPRPLEFSEGFGWHLGDRGGRALRDAVANNEQRRATALLDAGADATWRDPETGSTALAEAVVVPRAGRAGRADFTVVFDRWRGPLIERLVAAGAPTERAEAHVAQFAEHHGGLLTWRLRKLLRG